MEMLKMQLKQNAKEEQGQGILTVSVVPIQLSCMKCSDKQNRLISNFYQLKEDVSNSLCVSFIWRKNEQEGS
jgi:hypothetical protein